MLLGKAHKFGDDISADLHIFDKHTIFTRAGGDGANKALAETMLSRLDPEFGRRRNAGDFIVAGRNFGTLSMYDQSAAIVKAAGIAAIIAISFDDLFVRHAINRGLLLVECETTQIETGDDLAIDLARATVDCPARNLSLSCRIPHPTVQGWLNEGGVIEHLRRHGEF